jgi:hypothetical protein
LNGSKRTPKTEMTASCPSTARETAAGSSTSPACGCRRWCLPCSEGRMACKAGHGVAFLKCTLDEQATRWTGRAKDQHFHIYPTTLHAWLRNCLPPTPES